MGASQRSGEWLESVVCAPAGLHTMMALRAGAKHVTAVDRWLYMALACKETLVRHRLQPLEQCYVGLMDGVPVHQGGCLHSHANSLVLLPAACAIPPD